LRWQAPLGLLDVGEEAVWTARAGKYSRSARNRHGHANSVARGSRDVEPWTIFTRLLLVDLDGDAAKDQGVESADLNRQLSYA
jgi:hypothetical protein